MFLTRFEINPARRGAKKLLGSPHAMHAAVRASFPSSRDADGGRVLWRVDRTNPRTWLYVVGPDEPDLTHLVEQAGWPSIDTVETRPYDRLLDSLESGQRWAFRVTANPTKSTRLNGSERSQRVGHVTVEQQLAWFTARIGSWGAALAEEEGGPAVMVRDRRMWRFRRNGRQVTLSTATFDGELVVEDAKELRQSLSVGVGPAKAYGCGLMTLAPPRSAA